jgi:allophanate hydrolase
LKRESEAVWAAADVLVVPGAPTIYTRAEMAADPVALNARLGLYTNFVNLLDLAAIAVPAGFRPDGLPFGIALIGPAFSDRALAALGARFLGEKAIAVPAATVRVAVVGAHLSGMPLNRQLTERAARLVRDARTSADYRLYDLADGRPGLVRDGHGACIDVELWEMPYAGFGSFVAQIPPPLGIGTLQLEDGESVKGFVCETYAVAGKKDITASGGWRNYLKSK